MFQKNKKPSEKWLEFVKTDFARNHIKSKIRQQNKKLLPEIKEVEFNWNSQLAREGKEIERSEKYTNKKTGVPLSETDCFLLQHAIEHSYTLVTDDRTLINATIDSGGDVFNPREP